MEKQKLIFVFCLFFTLFYAANSATVQCARGSMLSFDAEEFFNEENTGVKFFYTKDYEEESLSAPKVLFFRRIGRAFRRVARHIGRGLRKVGSGIKKVARHVGRGIKRVGHGLKKVARHIGRGIKRIARHIGTVAKKAWKVVKKVVKVITKPIVSMVKAVKKAFKKLKKVKNIIKNYIGPKQKGGCASKYVCHYDCGTLINCPVKTSNTFDGFMDFTKRVKESKREMKAYQWVCKNSMFSGKSQRDSALSKFFRRIAFGVSKLSESEFEARNPNYSATKYDTQYLNWIRTQTDSNDMSILDILNDYKDGLSGFSKICTENPKWINELERNLRLFEANSLSESMKTNSGAESDSIVKSFKRIREYREDQRRKSILNPNAKYRFDLLNGLFNTLRQGFIDLIKGNQIQQEYCLCSDYGRFFDLMNKLPQNTRETFYGLDNIDFQNFYMENLKMTCVSRCSSAMKNKGYSTSQIQASLKSAKLNVDLNPDQTYNNEKRAGLHPPSNNSGKPIKQIVEGTKNTIGRVAQGTRKIVGRVAQGLRKSGKTVKRSVRGAKRFTRRTFGRRRRTSRKPTKTTTRRQPNRNTRRRSTRKPTKISKRRKPKFFGVFKKVAKGKGNPFQFRQRKRIDKPTIDDEKEIIKNPLVKLSPIVIKLAKSKENPFGVCPVPRHKFPTKDDKENIIAK